MSKLSQDTFRRQDLGIEISRIGGKNEDFFMKIGVQCQFLGQNQCRWG
jgi:hypothetical protein